MEKKMNLKLNGARQLSGVLRGFDPFMNLVIDDAIETCKTGEKRNVGMVVSLNIKYIVTMSYHDDDQG